MNTKNLETKYNRFLLEIINDIIDGVLSYRKAAKYFEQMTGEKISHEGLRKIVQRYLAQQEKYGRKYSDWAEWLGY